MSETRRSCSTRGRRTRRTSASRSSPITTPPAARPIADDPVKADYKPLPFTRLYMSEDEWKERLAAQPLARLTPFEAPPGARDAVDCGGRTGRNFAPERQNENANVFDAAVAHVRALRARGLNVIVAGWSDGSRERLSHVLAEHGLKSLEFVSSYHQAKTARAGALPLAVIALEQGFEAPDFAVIGEQDILGDRLIRQSRRRRRAQDVLAEASALTAGDLVVHIDHGVGRFVGLQTIEAAGAPHDCLEIHYAGGDRLFLPVENLELLSRYGSETGELDKLGGAGWQSRKARLKKRVREMAGELIRVAAQRMTHAAPRLTVPEGLYDEFCARFPYEETHGPGKARLKRRSTTWPPAGRWTGWSAATSASARPRSRCAPPSPRRSTASRPRSSRRRRCFRASIRKISATASPACRSASASSRAWSARPRAAR